MNCYFSNGLWCFIPCGSMDGFWEIGTHLRACGGCHVLTFPDRGVTNPVFHSWMKHLALDYHFVKQYVNTGTFKVSYVSSKDQLADGLTKPLARQRFLLLRSKTGVADGSTVLQRHIKATTSDCSKSIQTLSIVILKTFVLCTLYIFTVQSLNRITFSSTIIHCFYMVSD